MRWLAEGDVTFRDLVISGIRDLGGLIGDDSQVLVHYDASPFVSDGVVSDVVRVCSLRGNASPAHSQVCLAAER